MLAFIVLGWSYYGVIVSFFSDGFIGAFPVYYKYIVIIISMNILHLKLSGSKR
jgi:hypothetical protein